MTRSYKRFLSSIIGVLVLIFQIYVPVFPAHAEVNTSITPISDFTCTGKTDATSDFSFSKPEGAVSVKIQQSRDDGVTWGDAETEMLTPTSTNATVAGLSPSTSYKFKLVVEGGKNDGDSNIVSVTTNVTSLIAHYEFNGNAVDSSDSKHDGTENGGIQYTSGVLGQAAKFDGIDDSIALGNWFTYQDFTISMWVNPSDSQNSQYTDIIDNYHNGTDNWVIQNDKSDSITKYGFFDATAYLTPLRWQHVVWVKNVNHSTIYVNGKVVYDAGARGIYYTGGQYSSGNQNLFVGNWARYGGRNWKGMMDDLRIYDRNLSQYEISRLYNEAASNIPQPPATPYGLKITSLTGSTLTMSWDPAADPTAIEGYKVFRNGTEVGTTTDTKFTDSGLTANIAYSYYVKAFDKVGNISDASDSISGIPLPPNITDFVPANGINVGGNKLQEFKLIFKDNKNREGAEVNVEVSSDNINWIPAAVTHEGPNDFDGTNLYYSCSVDLGNFSSGSYYLRVTLKDASGFTDQKTVQYTVDTALPKAEAGDEKQTTAGTEVQFDGTGSSDNNGIASYEWDFGDGGRASSAQPVHTYAEEGEYTVTLVVKDKAGNAAEDTTKVKVLNPLESGVLRVKVQDDSTGSPIPGANVVVRFSDGTEMKYYTDSQGIVKAIGSPGHCYVYGYMTNYKANQVEGEISQSVSTNTTLKLIKGKLIDGEVTVKKMNSDEIIAAGIDPNRPENQWVYKFEMHLAFTPDTPIPSIIVNGYGGAISGLEPFTIPGGGSVRASKVYPYIVPNPGHPEVAPTVYYLVIPGEASWLKEFFEVGLTMINTSESDTPFALTNASATLNIPDGLTLMATSYSDNKTITIGTLNPGETKEVKWVLRGDKKGMYNLNAVFSGMLQPFNEQVTANFTTSAPFRVWGDDAIKMHIDAQDKADKGCPYHVRFGIENVSDVPVYNVTFGLKDDGKQNYIFAPNQQLEKAINELPAGQTVWVDYWLIPSISGTLDLSNSYILKTGADNVSIPAVMASHSDPENYPPAVPVLYQVHNSDGHVTLSWDEISGAQGYKIYSVKSDLTMSRNSELVYTAGSDEHSVTIAESSGEKDYIITTILEADSGTTIEQLKHAITGLSWCNSAGSPVITIDPIQIYMGKTSDLMITVNDQGFPVKQGTIDVGNYITAQPLDASGQAKVNITPTASGDIVVSAYDRDHNLLASKTIKVVSSDNTVTFNSNGGSAVESQTVTYNSSAVEPAAPTKTGYNFEGWYADSALTKLFDFKTLVTGDLTLYAKWNIIRGLTVSVTNENGTIAGLSQSYNYGDKVTLTASADSNYKFVNWTDSTGKVLSANAVYSFNITENTRLTANFAANTLFTVTFYNDAKQILKTQTLAQGQDATAPPDPIKPNYTFVGWDKTFTNIQSDLNIYPVFKANPITYTLTVNNGTGSGTYNASTSVTVSAAVPNGKQFGGWKDETGNTISYDQNYSFIITRNVELTAVLTDAPVTVLPQVTLDNNVTYNTTDPTYVQMYFLGTFTVPTGYQMIECGFVSIKNAAVNPGENLTLQTTGATIMKAGALNQAGQVYRVIKTTYGASFYVRGYMIYKNTTTGEIVTIYSSNVVLGVKTK